MIKIEVLTDKRTCKVCKYCSLNVVTKGYTCELLNRTITKHYKNNTTYEKCPYKELVKELK